MGTPLKQFILLAAYFFAALLIAIFVLSHYSVSTQVVASLVLAISFSMLLILVNKYTRKFLGVERLLSKTTDLERERDTQFKLLTQQKNELNAVLSSMTEGVIAIDMDEHVIKINHAAAKMLNVREEVVIGKNIQEVVRSREFENYVRRGISGEEGFEGEIILYNKSNLYLDTYVSALRDSSGKQIGVLILVNDLTDLRRLERVRKDFVSNVSHELKTPITSIQGFVETLLDGALYDPQDAQRFLKIIAKHTERLHSIIEDLLSLSRIEQSIGQLKIEKEERVIDEVLDAALQLCEPKALEKNISIVKEIKVRPNIEINFTLLSQALVNLLDNAIKFSPPASQVLLSSNEIDQFYCISVSDQGPGIADEHLSRVFERFYRVDEARSREMGGSGLGLAIVKHIMQAHGGYVAVESQLGLGTTFSLYLPKANLVAVSAA